MKISVNIIGINEVGKVKGITLMDSDGKEISTYQLKLINVNKNDAYQTEVILPKEVDLL